MLKGFSCSTRKDPGLAYVSEVTNIEWRSFFRFRKRLRLFMHCIEARHCELSALESQYARRA